MSDASCYPYVFPYDVMRLAFDVDDMVFFNVHICCVFAYIVPLVFSSFLLVVDSLIDCMLLFRDSISARLPDGFIKTRVVGNGTPCCAYTIDKINQKLWIPSSSFFQS